MRIKAIAIIILITLAIIITPKTVRASQNVYYLKRDFILDTNPPTGEPERIAISPSDGGGDGIWSNSLNQQQRQIYFFTWTSGNIPYNIQAGTYTIYVYMNADASLSTYISISISLIYNDNRSTLITMDRNINIGTSISEYIFNGSSNVMVPEGAKLTVSVGMFSSDSTYYFYYDGESCPARVVTPQVLVPEFPIEVFVFSPILLVLYIALKHYLPKSLMRSGA